MAKVTIRGASDDLVEVEGGLREEFNPCGDGPSYLGFSDGTVVSLTYESGLWRIQREMTGGAAYHHEPAGDVDSKNYSDIVTLTGDNLRWVVFGHDMEPKRRARR